MLKNLHMKEFIRVLSLMEKKKWPFLISMFVGCLSYVGQQIILAFVNREMINAAAGREVNLLVKAVILAIIALILICIIGPVFGYIYEANMKKAITTRKLKVFSHVVRLPVSYFEATHSGDIISRCTNDMNVFEDAYRQINTVVLSVLYGISSAAAMLLLDIRLAALMILLGVISSIVNIQFSGSIRKFSDEIQASLGILSQYLVDILAGFRVIKLFNIGNIIIEKYIEQNNHLTNTKTRRIMKDSKLNSVNYLLSSINLIGVLIVGAFMVKSGTVQFGTVVAIISLQSGVTSMFSNLGNFFTQLQASLAGASRIFELLDEKEEENLFDNNKVSYGNEVVRLENITFAYDNNEIVLENIDISVEKGQVIALVGSSGGGKSTIAELILGFYTPKSGNIFINGKCANSYTLQELRSFIGYVPQDAYLFDGTIKENLSYGKAEASMEEIISAAKAANAHDFIMQQPEGYDTLVGERGVKLSGGQKQRMAIARALLKDAPILLLDEATSALDSQAEQLVQDALNRLMKGRTTIIIAHRLSTIMHSDIIYVIDNGKIVEKGDHDSLIKGNGLYSQLSKLQFASGKMANVG